MSKYLDTEFVRGVLAFGMAFVFLAVMGVLLLKDVPADNRDFFNIGLGALIGAFSTIIGWYFGSSSGSAEKTKIMSETPKPE